MTISRGKRVIGGIINAKLWIGNLILPFAKKTTIGGLVAHYEFEKDGFDLVILFLFKCLSGLITIFTFGIFWIVDICTMQNRNGTFAEAWANNRKVELGGSNSNESIED